MSEPDEDRVAIPRDDFHVCAYRIGKRWHFVIIFPKLPYFEWDSWLDGGWHEGYHTARDAEQDGALHLAESFSKLNRLQTEGELIHAN